jgi:hypothetical protein
MHEMFGFIASAVMFAMSAEANAHTLQIQRK